MNKMIICKLIVLIMAVGFILSAHVSVASEGQKKFRRLPVKEYRDKMKPDELARSRIRYFPPGGWDCDGGKADIYLDGQLVRTIDTYYWVGDTGYGWAYLYHVLDLPNEDYTIRIVLNGDINPKATGIKIYISGAIVYGINET